MFAPSGIAAILAAVAVPAAAQSASLQSLYDVLNANGASSFAAAIQANPELATLYSSGMVQTVFAPSDDASVSTDGITRRAVSIAEMQNQACLSQFHIAQDSIYGSAQPTALIASKQGDSPQHVVTDKRPINATILSRRHLGRHPGGLYGGSSSLVARNTTTAVPPPSLLRIDSGLGAVSNIIQADIPFDGGVVQITDSYFTVPVSLSATATQTGQTAFNSLLASNGSGSGNLTNTLDNTPNITVFLPSNAAFAAAGVNGSASSLSAATLLSNHVVSGFVGYLPTLTDGLTLTTQSGEVLTVSIRNDIWYINDARISQANLVLDSGVAHVIDKVLTPKPAVVTALGVPAVKAGWTPVLCATLTLLALFV